MPHELNGLALRSLAKEFKQLQEEPVEGFRVKLVNKDDLFEWEVAIFGPPNTLYEGGYFKAIMTFTDDYPFSLPILYFLDEIWHPNISEDGLLCISILHSQDDETLYDSVGESSNELLSPVLNVRIILLSVISLLDEPNTAAPASIFAASMYEEWKESKGSEKEYEEIIKEQVLKSRKVAEMDNVVIPTSIEEYCIKTVIKRKNSDNKLNKEESKEDEKQMENREDEKQVKNPKKKRKI